MNPTIPQTIYVLSKLLESGAFYILPSSELYATNPQQLPREVFIRDDEEVGSNTTKKIGRPSKRDKQKRARDALAALDRWLDKSSHVYQQQQPNNRATTSTTHIMISQPPITSRNAYRFQKSYLLDSLDAFRSPDANDEMEGQNALVRANEAVLTRLKEIDEMAASQGMEVGGEGGEKTGLARVERAVAGLKSGGGNNEKRGGILSLLEGSGLADGSGTGNRLP